MFEGVEAYRELLTTCDFSPEEIDNELPRLKKAFDKAGLTVEDVKRCRERMITYFEADTLRGARMALGLHIRAFVDMVMAGEEHDVRIYGHLPLMAGHCVLGAAELARPDAYIGLPDLICHMVLGAFFNKLDPLLEASEAWCLPAGLAHCGCSQAKIGGRLTDVVPPATLHVSAGNYCDEAPKVDEVLAYHFKEPVVWCNRCQDESFDDPPMDDRHLKYFSANIRRTKDAISEAVGAEVTNQMIMQTMMATEEVGKEFKRIQDYRAESDPSPISVVTTDMAAALVGIDMTPRGLSKVAEMMKVLADEVQDRVERGVGVVPKGAPRVMYAYVLPFASPAVGKAFEEAGLNVCVREGYGSMPIWSRREEIAKLDPCDIVAGIFLHNPTLVKPRWRADVVVLGYNKAKLDGIVMLPHYSCRVFGTDFPMMRDMVRKELGDIPITVLETDVFDPRYYTAEQARTRIESFSEMVRAAKASAA
ncbi:MAG: 2-hydroxyacyl-CoA dehydratase family protein [Actinobacteria bacterium]|nr:2-hydroxyacyl-CoA dehydratase family protein [Actinomycetota bacterium]